MTYGQPQVEDLLDGIDTGRGAHGAVVLPVPSVSALAVGEVRSTVRSIVDRDLPAAEQHDIQLVASELVTNALEHGDPPVKMVLHESTDAVVIAVFDRSVAEPDLAPSETAGMHIIDRLTDGRWGVVHRSGGKWVWAALSRATDPAA